jgi:hypothetical protein
MLAIAIGQLAQRAVFGIAIEDAAALTHCRLHGFGESLLDFGRGAGHGSGYRGGDAGYRVAVACCFQMLTVG